MNAMRVLMLSWWPRASVSYTFQILFNRLVSVPNKMQANGINYYKGVLLCSRPNESPTVTTKKQFCGRVFPHEQLGLVPVKQFDQRKTKKRVLPVLNNHKKWLEHFKKEVHEQKEQEEKEKEKVIQRLEKIKQEGYQEREKAKNAPETLPQQNENKQAKQAAAQSSQPHKKKEKPAWAKTAQQAEESAEKEVDDLIDFFNGQETADLKDYVSDDEVKHLLVDLKSKIQKLKQQEDWKGAQMRKIQEEKKEEKEKQEKDDVLSRISKQSGAQSVASQKTAERVEELQRKKKEVEWDKHTTSEKSKASVDEQIAKNIADEVLRNYPALKHHSNQSIRQLIEKHAHQQVKS